MMVAKSTPIKCICVGNNLIRVRARLLAYSPMRCTGVTPSAQVPGQVMSFFAVRMKDAYTNKSSHVPTTGVMKRNENTAKFATILRRSCTCTQAGVVCRVTSDEHRRYGVCTVPPGNCFGIYFFLRVMPITVQNPVSAQ